MENVGYQVGAPSGNTGEAVFSIPARRSPSARLPACASFCTTLSREGMKDEPHTLSWPLRPEKSSCVDAETNQSMNLAAACGYLACFGMPMPSGLDRFEAGPLTPGVARYWILPLTVELSVTL